MAGYDVSDAYRETLTADGKGVVFKGSTVPIQTIDEVISLQSGAPLTYSVQVVPHHRAHRCPPSSPTRWCPPIPRSAP